MPVLGQNDFLTASGKHLIKADGTKVILNGTNFGGWLVREIWMDALAGEGIEAGGDIVRTLEERFGRAKADELIKIYEDNFITCADYDTIKALGFNCVRIPFWYRNLFSDEEGTWRRKEDGEIDFTRLDTAVEECSKRGIYVILDLHGTPGHQSIAHHSGAVGSCRLYEHSPQGKRYRDLTVKLWRETARHFRGNPAVAAYDLMNEPMCDWNGREKDVRRMWEVYDLLYRAVRSEDPEHVITIEAIWTFFNLPRPKKFGWENVMYQLHLYMDKNIHYSAVVPFCNAFGYNVPVLIGEFHPHGKATWEHLYRVFDRAGYSRLTWTYKGHSNWGSLTDWFLFCSLGDDRRVDITKADEAEIREKWAEPVRTENFTAVRA